MSPDERARLTRAVVERFMAAMSTLDTEAMLAETADDIVVRLPAAPPGLPREAVGKAAFREFLSGVGLLWTSWSMPHRAVHPLADDPGRAVVEYTSDSTNSDGSPYRNTYLSMARVRDGRLAEFTEFFDPEQVARAVAALRATAADQG